VFPGPLSIPLGPFKNVSKIRTEIFANECLSAVSTTLAIKEKNFELHIFFHILLRAHLNALYTCRSNFCLFFIFRSRQAALSYHGVTDSPKNINSRISPRMFKKILNGPREYSWPQGTLIYEKKPEVECQTPCKECS
jgi:hypothetical protein